MADNEKGVVVRLTSGAEYGLRSEADAKRIYPNAVIVRYQDGSPYGATSADADKPISKMNREDLEAHAVKVGVANPDDKDLFPTVATLRDAVTEAESNNNG